MFLIREVEPKDIEDLYKLASMANFINLPKDRSLLSKKIVRSVNSFRNRQKESSEAEYMFVMEDLENSRIVGSSMIAAQHGTPEEPHSFFSVLPKRKVSRSLHMGFLHQVLRLGFIYDGPSEIGGLVLAPEYRAHPDKLGKLLSFSRFVYVAARRPQFKDEILCELMPPFNDRGESPIWEEIGRKFTNLRYDEADRLSRRNKEFITNLFPEGDIYTCMLSGEAREAIGEVGSETLPVKKMLESIGFTYRNMIDPFDGGPHYWAKTNAIEPVKRSRRIKVAKSARPNKALKAQRSSSGIVMSFSKKGLRAAKMEIQFHSANEILLNNDLKEALGIEDSTELWYLEVDRDPTRKNPA
jgi:arginine N-succinyltransferase